MAKHKIKPVLADPDFVKEEEKLLKHWYESGIVKKYLHLNDKSKKKFTFLDGPITANNPMGVHHGWSRTYKDLWQRYYNLKGYKQRFQNGFDCQGLWVEVEVEKDLGFKSKKDIQKYGVAKFVQKCRDRVIKYAAIQTNQSQRLGYFMDWDNSYFTMSDENNYAIWNFLKVCHENHWLYQGNDSVPWCPRCETAISQHEILTEDYRELTHESVYFKLRLTNNEFLLVWTTTPWTIPANIAVAVDAKLKYSLVEHNHEQFWVAAAAAKRIFSKPKVLKTVLGKNLVGLKYSGPFDDLPAAKMVSIQNNFHTVIPTDPLILPISTEEGTGLVHTAVSAGSEDYQLGQKLGLPLIPVIADNADYLPGLGWLTGQNAKNNPRIIIDYLQSENWLLKIENYKHRYPVCWRCKTELVWKVTEEWFLAMDKGKPSLRERMIAVAKKINWLPSFGLDRELDWLNNMHDWLISKKNRYWGLCLPIWQCPKCRHFEVIGSKSELKQKAVAGWDEFTGKSPHKPQLDQVKIKCVKCGETASRIEPVGNPWLDAGIVSVSTLPQDWFPADFITESFPGQFKNWFYSLIAMAAVLKNSPPFKTVLGFASVLAEDGRAMHKSLGNAIEFNEGAAKIGVDIMRWLYCRQNPTQNLLFGFHTADQVKRQFHLILWNSYRFFANSTATRPKNILDKWVLSRFTNTLISVTKYLDQYDAFHATKAIETFVTDLSLWYIRRSRTSIHFETLFYIFTNLSRILAPFIPFLADRIYTNLTGEQSVHLSSWPKAEHPIDKTLESQMQQVRDAVEQIHAKRKELAIPVRQPLAAVSLNLKLDKSLTQLILDETNIKTLKFSKTFSLDTKLTPALIAEGEARKLIRQIQEARKKANTSLTERVTVTLPSWPQDFTDYIESKTLSHLLQGPEFSLKRHA